MMYYKHNDLNSFIQVQASGFSMPFTCSHLSIKKFPCDMTQLDIAACECYAT